LKLQKSAGLFSGGERLVKSALELENILSDFGCTSDINQDLLEIEDFGSKPQQSFVSSKNDRPNLFNLTAQDFQQVQTLPPEIMPQDRQSEGESTLQ